MATLLVATLCAWLIEVGGPERLVAAAAVFIVCGALVEFWWPGLAVCQLAWTYCRRPNWLRLVLWISALAFRATSRGREARERHPSTPHGSAMSG